MSGEPLAPQIRLVEIEDERDPHADQALELIVDTFPPAERQSMADLRSEIAEKRLGLLAAYDFHLLAAIHPAGHVVGTVAGVYLEGVNAGFVTYLAVRAEARGRRVARRLRAELVEALRADARRAGCGELAWVIGEVQPNNAWLRRLVRHRGALPFDLEYYHPAQSEAARDVRYTLYRQPIGDAREELPVGLVRRLLYSIYRRAYRVRYPLQRDGFQAMLRELEARDIVGVDLSLKRERDTALTLEPEEESG